MWPTSMCGKHPIQGSRTLPQSDTVCRTENGGVGGPIRPSTACGANHLFAVTAPSQKSSTRIGTVSTQLGSSSSVTGTTVPTISPSRDRTCRCSIRLNYSTSVILETVGVGAPSQVMTSASQVSPPTFVVVVVYDELLIRAVAVDALSGAGFVAIEARHAEEALAILEAQSAEVHVLFTDVHMPGEVNGLKLAHHTRHHWPWIALLVASGHARPEPHEIPASSRFLPKPYSLDVMLSHVRDLVAASPS